MRNIQHKKFIQRSQVCVEEHKYKQKNIVHITEHTLKRII